MDEPQWDRLAAAMRDRRADLRLSTRQAAIAAQIDRNTWDSAEKGKRIRDTGWPGIEDALGWSPGSVREILAGGEPTLRPGATQVIRPDGVPSSSSVGSPTITPQVRVTAGTARAVATAHGVTSRSGDFDLAEEIDFVSRQHQLPVEERMRMVKRLVQLWREHQEREEAARVQARAATK